MMKKLGELTSIPQGAERVGAPFLLDERRLSDGSYGWQRAGERGIDTRANAVMFIEKVRGTSGNVAQGYRVPVATDKGITVETELSGYDVVALRDLRKYRS